MDKPQAHDPIFSVLDRPQASASQGEAGPGQMTQAQVQRFGQKTLGEILVERKKITEEQLREALKIQLLRGGTQKVGAILLESELIEQADILQGLAVQLELPYLEQLPISEIDAELVRDLSIGFALRT